MRVNICVDDIDGTPEWSISGALKLLRRFYADVGRGCLCILSPVLYLRHLFSLGLKLAAF